MLNPIAAPVAAVLLSLACGAIEEGSRLTARVEVAVSNPSEFVLNPALPDNCFAVPGEPWFVLFKGLSEAGVDIVAVEEVRGGDFNAQTNTCVLFAFVRGSPGLYRAVLAPTGSGLIHTSSPWLV